ncbi:probable glutamate receptor [Haliotis cracherodii]|uniref:probable glutamate receptor n=1 Tax=Haliotis cracherodii TaxID=6455 RepID=UPI0039EC809E
MDTINEESVKEEKQYPKKLFATMKLRNTEVKFRLDCGATVNLLPENLYSTIYEDPKLADLQDGYNPPIGQTRQSARNRNQNGKTEAVPKTMSPELKPPETKPSEPVTVQSEKAELVIAPISVSRSREEVIDFTVPYFYVDSGIIVRTPSAGTLLTLISPFRYKVHICIAISLFLTTALLLLMEKVSSDHSPFQPVDKLKHYGDTAFNIFGALMYQGCNSPPMSSSRILLSAWLLFTVILAAAYGGNLIASMTDGRQKVPFSTLAELAQQDTYQWGLLGGTSFVTLFKNSNRSDYQAILQGMEINSDGDTDADSINTDIHLRRVLKGRYAFIGDENDFELMQSKFCDLQFMKEQFSPVQFAVGLPNDSVNTKIFSNEVLHIYESGLPRYWYDRWLPKSQCQMQWRQQPYRVNLMALQSLFYVSGAGVVLAGCLLLAEILYSSRRYKTRDTEGHVTR